MTLARYETEDVLLQSLRDQRRRAAALLARLPDTSPQAAGCRREIADLDRQIRDCLLAQARRYTAQPVANTRP